MLDPALEAFAEAFRLWEELPESARDPIVGARLLRKRVIVQARWGASLRTPTAPIDTYRMLERARSLVPADEQYERARLDVCEAFIAQSGFSSQPLPPELRPSVERGVQLASAAREEFARRGDGAAESEALDVLGALASHIGRYDDETRYARERLTIPDITLIERVDAVGMATWSRVLAGAYDEAVAIFDQHLVALRPGEPEAFYPFPHMIAILAARTGGRWDDAIRLLDRLAADPTRSDAPVMAMAWVIGAFIARARLDQPRAQRYATLCAQLVDGLKDDQTDQALYRAFFEDDDEAIHGYLGRAQGNSLLVGNILSQLLLERDILAREEALAHLEASTPNRPTYVDARIALVRAARSGAPAMRTAIATLEAAGIHGDTPRAAGLLARLTGDPADRADAERRLLALGDRAYIARLDEPVELRNL